MIGDNAISVPASLPQQLANTLRREICDGFRIGEKLPGMHVLRKRFGVSINTIGSAMDILAGEGLVEKRRGSGVYVRHRGISRRVGILSELDLFDPRISLYFRAVARCVDLQLQENGAEVKIYTGRAEPGAERLDTPTCPQFWEDIAAGRLDGAVVLNTPATDAWYFRLQSCPVPLVGPLTGYDAEVDVAGMSQAAVRQLAMQGCRRLGFMAAYPAEVFLPAAAAAGMQTHADWTHCGIDAASRGSGWECFRDIWSSRYGRPDGLVILDDMLFSDAQLAIYELGVRVPEDLRLAVQVSRDASPVIRVPVTLIEQDPAERAACLAEMLMARMRGELHTPSIRRLSFSEGSFQPEIIPEALTRGAMT